MNIEQASTVLNEVIETLCDIEINDENKPLLDACSKLFQFRDEWFFKVMAKNDELQKNFIQRTNQQPTIPITEDSTYGKVIIGYKYNPSYIDFLNMRLCYNKSKEDKK
jgi:hypothetical protein